MASKRKRSPSPAAHNKKRRPKGKSSDAEHGSSPPRKNSQRKNTSSRPRLTTRRAQEAADAAAFKLANTPAEAQIFAAETAQPDERRTTRAAAAKRQEEAVPPPPLPKPRPGRRSSDPDRDPMIYAWDVVADRRREAAYQARKAQAALEKEEESARKGQTEANPAPQHAEQARPNSGNPGHGPNYPSKLLGPLAAARAKRAGLKVEFAGVVLPAPRQREQLPPAPVPQDVDAMDVDEEDDNVEMPGLQVVENTTDEEEEEEEDDDDDDDDGFFDVPRSKSTTAAIAAIYDDLLDFDDSLPASKANLAEVPASVDDLFATSGPPSKLTEKFLARRHHLSSPPIESEGSGSDFEEGRALERKERRRRTGASSSEEEEDELAEDVVMSSPERETTSLEAEDTAAAVGEDDDLAPSALDKGKGKAVPLPESPRAPFTQVPPSVQEEDDENEQQDGAAASDDKGKPGRHSAEFIKACRAFGLEVTMRVGQIGAQFFKTSGQVIQAADLNYISHRSPNFWNDFQQHARLLATDEDLGAGLDEFRRKVLKRYEEEYKNKSPEEKAAVEERIRGDLLELSQNESVVRNAYRRFMSAEQEVQSLLTSICRFNKDIQIFAALIYTGKDHATLQRSGVITGSEEGRLLLQENNIKVEELVDGLTAKAKAQLADRLMSTVFPTDPAATASTSASSGLSRAEKKGRLASKTLVEDPAEVTVGPVEINLTATEFRNIVTQALMSKLHDVEGSTARRNFPWSTLAAHGLRFQFHVVGWPVQKVPKLPHNKEFVPGLASQNAWKALYDQLYGKVMLSLEPWTEEEKRTVVGSVEYSQIPLITDIDNRVHVRVGDIKAAHAKISRPSKAHVTVQAATAPPCQAPAAHAQPLVDLTTPSPPPPNPPRPPAIPTPASQVLPQPAVIPTPASQALSGVHDMDEDEDVVDPRVLAHFREEIAALKAQLLAKADAAPPLKARPAAPPLKARPSFAGYEVVKEGTGPDDPPHIALRKPVKPATHLPSPASSQPATNVPAAPPRGELGSAARRRSAVPVELFYKTTQPPPSARQRSPHHAAAHTVPLTSSSASASAARSAVASSIASSSASAVAASGRANFSHHIATMAEKHDQFYKGRHWVDGMDGPSREVFRDE